MSQTDSERGEPLHRVLIRQAVPEHAKVEYERWLRRLHADLSNQPGFESVEVVRHGEEGVTQFIVLAAFRGEETLEQWLRSGDLADLRRKLDDIAGTSRNVLQVTGREIWFDGDDPVQPAYWKRVVLTAVCVLPTIYLTEFLIDLTGIKLSGIWHQIASVLILCAMLTWPIMPVATRIAKGWLVPKQRGRDPQSA